MKTRVISFAFVLLSAAIVFTGVSCSLLNNGNKDTGGVSSGLLTVSGSVTGNIFGKKLGMVVYTMSSNYTLIGSNWSAPVTASSFSYSVQTAVASGCFVQYGVYEDVNNDLGYTLSDPVYVFGQQAYGGSSINYNPVIVGKVLTGTITGADATIFNRISIYYKDLPISGTSFSVQYYVAAGSASSNSYSIWCDQNGNGMKDTEEPYVYHTNQLYITGITTTTDTVNFSVAKTSNYLAIDPSSDDYTAMKFIVGTNLIGKAWTNFSYYFAGSTGSLGVYIANDINGDGIRQTNEGSISFPIYNTNSQTLIAKSYIVKKTVINLTINNYSAYSKPLIYNYSAHYNSGDYPITGPSMVITNYCVTNCDYSPYWGIYPYNDWNNNGYYDFSGEQIAPSMSWSGYVPSTNLTVNITN